MISLFYPFIPPKALEAVTKILSGKDISQGKVIEDFEKKFGEKLGHKYCVTTNSGTSALHLAYILSGIKKGDEVIIPVLTCTATSHAALYAGAKIVFADIDPKTLCIDPESVAKKITKKTKAIVAVHFAGNPCDMKELSRIAGDIPIIEDSAQHVEKTNPTGNFICYSFQAIKHITTVDGGMLVCKNEQDYKRAKRLRWYGIDREQRIKLDSLVPQKQREMTFDVDEMGYKYNMTNVDAAIGLEGLKKLDWHLEHRAKLVQRYRDGLKEIRGIELLRPVKDSTNWMFMILVADRDNFQKFMKENEIETNMVHVRNDIYKVFGGKKLDLPKMNAIEDRYAALPLHWKMTLKDVDLVVETIKEWTEQ